MNFIGYDLPKELHNYDSLTSENQWNTYVCVLSNRSRLICKYVRTYVCALKNTNAPLALLHQNGHEIGYAWCFVTNHCWLEFESLTHLETSIGKTVLIVIYSVWKCSLEKETSYPRPSVIPCMDSVWM